jgi:hypothetical protein
MLCLGLDLFLIFSGDASPALVSHAVAAESIEEAPKRRFHKSWVGSTA